MEYILIGLLLIVGYVVLLFSLAAYREKKRAYRQQQYEKAEREKAQERKANGKLIIDRANLTNSIKQVVRRAVNHVVREMQSTYMDCDESNIWLTGMFTFQLQCKLENAYIKALELTSNEDIEECKEFVRAIIKTCHLEAVKIYPELKEY